MPSLLGMASNPQFYATNFFRGHVECADVFQSGPQDLTDTNNAGGATSMPDGTHHPPPPLPPTTTAELLSSKCANRFLQALRTPGAWKSWRGATRRRRQQQQQQDQHLETAKGDGRPFLINNNYHDNDVMADDECGVDDLDGVDAWRSLFGRGPPPPPTSSDVYSLNESFGNEFCRSEIIFEAHPQGDDDECEGTTIAWLDMYGCVDVCCVCVFAMCTCLCVGVSTAMESPVLPATKDDSLLQQHTHRPRRSCSRWRHEAYSETRFASGWLLHWLQ